jgi:nucleotide-binding universal stress UspA family protein
VLVSIDAGDHMTMTPYRSVFVPLDGSPFAEQALPLAVDFARQAGAILQVALVHDPVPALASALDVPVIDAQLDQETRVREQAYLKGIEKQLGDSVKSPITSILLDRPVVPSLQSHIERSGADLVMMTTHGRGPLSRFWLGSVADQLMRRLRLPIVLVRPFEDSVAPVSIRRILITLDGSPFAEQAVDAAVALGKPFNAEYGLLMVLEPPLPIADPIGMMLMPAPAGQSKQRAEAACRYLEDLAVRLRKDGYTVKTHVVEGPAAARTIIDQTDDLQADLVAIASHGQGGFQRLVMGSVADKVIRGGSHPTLVVRPPVD